MKQLKLDSHFILEHMDELITLEDYVPFSFDEYNKQHEREDFLRDKGLFATITRMTDIINQKCDQSEDFIVAYNTVVCAWLDAHREFEEILTEESLIQYKNLKKNPGGLLGFLREVQLPSEKKVWTPPNDSERGLRDDSSIKFNLNKIDRIIDEFGFTLLSDYLIYLIV